MSAKQPGCRYHGQAQAVDEHDVRSRADAAEHRLGDVAIAKAQADGQLGTILVAVIQNTVPDPRWC